MKARDKLQSQKKKRSKTERQKAINKADKETSLYIRHRDSRDGVKGKCVTCDKVDEIKNMDCGHFISRTRMGTRFDERNMNLQCKGCNLRQSKGLDGIEYRHGLEIDKKWGNGTAEELINISKQINKLSVIEIEEIAENYRTKLNENKKKRN